MKAKRITLIVVILVITLCMTGAGWSAPMGTAFTYQGDMVDSNSPAEGLYDMQFKLYDDPNTLVGSQFGLTIDKDDVDVLDGQFVVELDFVNDPNVFDGEARWLQVAIRPGESIDPCDFVTLSPRQEITPTPYALYSKETRGIFVDGIGNVGIGDENPLDKLDVNGHIDSTETYKLGGMTVLSNKGSYNIFVGKGAGANNLTGQQNSAVGYHALVSNTTGQGNSAMGNNALNSNDTGQSNTGIGSWALQYNTSGIYNSAVGSWALNHNTTGNYNSAMGTSALNTNTIGSYNTAVGYGALLENNEGNGNAAVGSYAIRCNLTGGANSAIGDSALYYNTTGNYNSAIGSGTLMSNSTGRYNSAVGYQAGYSNSTGNGNVFLGYKAGYNETGSNKLYIANSEVNPPLIYGDFSTGYLGLGTTTPSTKLDVDGTVNATAFVGDGSGLTGIATGDSDWTISGDDMYSAVSGNVGIGTTSPGSAKLKASHTSAGFTGYFIQPNNNNGDIAIVAAQGTTGISSSIKGAVLASGSSNGHAFYDVGGSKNSFWSPVAIGASDPGTAKLYVSGNVGIGNATPLEKLDVTGHINSTETYKLGGSTVLSNTGGFNIFVGKNAGYSTTIGQQNSALGYYALNNNTEGHFNSAIGYRSLNLNTTGNNNSALGAQALGSNTNGQHNSATGFNALFSNTTGDYNSAMGSNALYSNTTASNNSAVGYNALRSNTTGYHNTAMGYSALYSNTTGNYNTGIGNYANHYNNEGSRNTMLGYSAGQGTAAHNKSGNVFIGYQAGYNETGSDKLYIENSDSPSPLIYGEFDNDLLVVNGTLDVKGPIWQRGSVLHADYVFEADYDLESIEDHAESMWTNKHLPAVPKAQTDETGAEVINLGSHRRGMLEELEKAHIYIEQLHEQNKRLEQRLVELEARLESLEKG